MLRDILTEANTSGCKRLYTESPDHFRKTRDSIYGNRDAKHMVREYNMWKGKQNMWKTKVYYETYDKWSESDPRLDKISTR